jgi:3',5'-cyclic AMP phosphodiesterase CpdA
VLVTGDLADHGTAAEYAHVRRLLEPLGARLIVLPGNHDDRAALRAGFDLEGTDAEPVLQAFDLGPLTVLALDSTRPGADDGRLDAPRLAWLEAALAERPQQPVLLAMHHPPLRTGVPAEDAYALAGDDRAALAQLIDRHPQVRAVACGHLHRTIVATLAGRPVLVLSSVYVQARFHPVAAEPPLADATPAVALHTLIDGELVTHVEPIR